MQAVPQSQNETRWQPPSYLKLRKGQSDLYKVLSQTEKNRYAIQLPTGYGKSYCACIAYAVLRGKGKVDRALFVVPTDSQRQQYIDNLSGDLRDLGIQVRGIEKCNGQSWIIKKSLRNESEIFVASVQSIQSDAAWFADLMTKGSWLVVADEFHHYGEDNCWGKAVSQLNYAAILGMSATPLRGDRKPTIFGDVEFDVTVSIEDALEEGAIRRIEGVVCEYEVTWGTADDPDPQTALMSELLEMQPEGISEWELKKGVRYYTKYVHSIFIQALNAWTDYESKAPGQNQILVFAMTCKHAESIVGVINSLAQPGLPEPFADWIGVGNGESENRTDEQNHSILQAFQDNKLPCLVQVNKAGEGFNNKRCSIGIFLDLIGDTPTKRQHIGRFMRINQAAPNLPALIFVSSDSPSLPLIKKLEEQAAESLRRTSDTSPDRTSDRDYSFPEIPDLYVIDTKYHSQERVYPYGNKEAAISAFKTQVPEMKDLPDEMIERALHQAMDKWVPDIYGLNKAASSEASRKLLAEQVNRAIGIVVNVFIKMRYGKSFPSNARKDVFRMIHGKWKREHGGQDALTESELREKHAWAKELREQILKNQIPVWMNQ